MAPKSYHQRQYLSEGEILRDWTLSQQDRSEIAKYHKKYRLLIGIQFCSLRLYGKFAQDPERTPINAISYLNKQLKLSPTMEVSCPEREATWIERERLIQAIFLPSLNAFNLKIETFIKENAYEQT